MIKRDWYGCYGEGWGKAIVPEAYSHPAKFSRALIRRIYDHAFERGWISADDTVVDPFGGVALGALDAMRLNLRWVGVELEQHFIDTGQGCNCTGVSKADWVRFQGRLDKARYLDGRHICPRCLAQARAVLDSPAQRTLFDCEREPNAGYMRNSGRIPEVSPHRYAGNVETWRDDLPGTGRLLHGDSRGLAQVIRRASVCVSSPPYAGNSKSDYLLSGDGKTRARDERRGYIQGRGCFRGSEAAYGTTPGQLGVMSEGDFAAVVSSPPYAGIAVAKNSDDIDIEKQYETYRASGGGQSLAAFRETQCKHSRDYGMSPGQLSAMGEGDFAAAISSPPFVESLASDDPDKRGGLFRDPKRRNDKTLTAEYGTSAGQLGAMSGRGFDAAVSSPPWENVEGSNAARKHANPEAVAEKRSRGYASGRLQGHRASKEAILHQLERENEYRYGDSPGQLGTMQGGFGAAVSSPPYEGSVSTQDRGGIDWEKANRPDRLRDSAQRHAVQGDMPMAYGTSPAQIGNDTGETFWTAARAIVEQTYQVLRPGGVAVWVTKAFVRNKARVDFPGQWLQLCEVVGFEPLEWIRAWMIEEHGAQYDLDGGLQTYTVERKSFFRRLAEKNGSPSIDYEVVIVVQKPAL